jgi:hypothetical protein
MRKFLSVLISVFIVTSISAQTLNVVVGEVTYAIPAAEAGDMVYSNGSTLTILNKSFSLSDVDNMYVDDTQVTDNTVSVAYSGTFAKVTVAGNVAQYLTVTASGADVNIVQSASLAKEITYTLSGTSTDGSFYMDGELKATLVLNGLTLTNADGYAIDIQDGKRIAVVLSDGTTNTLTDGAGGSQKACFMVNGHTEFEGGGSLVLYGNTAHAFWGDEYVLLKKTTGTITVKSAVKDGFNINQYFEQKGGTINISGVGDDGIQVSADTEDDATCTGYALLTAGTQNITVTGTATKGLNTEGNVTVTSGTYAITTTGGGEYDSDEADTKTCTAISSDANITINGGTLTLTSTGLGGKGLKCDSVLTINDGTITVKTSGGIYKYTTSLTSSAKGIKAKGNLNINGGTISVTTTGEEAEGIESKSVLTIAGGTVEVSSTDDCINSSSHMYITGGKIYVTASGNDGLDSNGNMYIKGGTIVAYGTTSPECGIDANEEENYTVYFTGGTLIGVGGSNSHPTTSASTQGYVSYSGSVSNGTTLLLRNGSTDILAFTMGRSYTSSGGGMGPNGGGMGPGGGGSTNFIITSPNISSGSSYTLYSGASVSGDNWHGLYTSPTVSSAGSSKSTLTAVNYSSGR